MLPPELSSVLRFRILGNKEILGKVQNWVQTYPSAKSRLTLFRMGFFGAAQGLGGGQKDPPPPLPKICRTYPAMMKHGTAIPYLKKSKRYMNYVTHALSSADISNFAPEINKFCYIKKHMYRLHFDTKFVTLLTFLESIRIVLIKKLQFWWCQQKWLPQAFLK